MKLSLKFFMKVSLRIIIAFVAHFWLRVTLNSNENNLLESRSWEEVYLILAEGFVKRSIYRQKQASHQWYVKFNIY